MASNYNIPSEEYCQYCNKKCKNLNALKQHEIRCSKNKNRIKVCFSDSDWRQQHMHYENYHYVPWNKGLTKATDNRIQLCSEKVSNALKGKVTGKASTPEKELARREKISQTMKCNPKAGGLRYGSGRGKKGKYKGYYCDSTYELVYIIYNLDHNIKFKRCDFSYTYTYKNEQHEYFPDFILEDGSLVEIKGFLTNKDISKMLSVTDKYIHLLLEKDLKYAFDYVKNNYSYKKLSDLYD